MNNLVPYISSEPPPIQNDNFDMESHYSENFNSYRIGDSVMRNIPNESMEIDQYTDQNNQLNSAYYQYNNYGRDNSIPGRNPAELYDYIEKVIDENNLRVDFTDSAGNNDDKSDKSFDGEFDDYIDSITCKKDSFEKINKNNVIDTQDDLSQGTKVLVEDNSDVYISNILSNTDSPCDLIDKCNKLEINDFANSTPKLNNSQTDYFFNKTNVPSVLESESQSDDFADFSMINYSPKIVDNNEISHNSSNNNECNLDANNDFDDDFEDFATFEQSSKIDSEKLSVSESQIENLHQTMNSSLQNLLTNFDYGESEMLFTSNTPTSNISLCDSFISNQKLFDDVGLLVWKELTNYDYSPAFIFHWMQSATYERFMSSIGPEYKEMLSSHRATLPLYSVNLNPIEPILVDSYLQSNPSASSSSNDLVSGDINISSTGVSEKASNIDLKDLEEEFIFNQFSSPSMETKLGSIDSDVVSAIPPAMIQSERFSGILKSFLKPLGGPSGKSDSSSSRSSGPLAEAVLNELPDLSYMSAKVLMFPVLSAGCDVEDNI